MVQLYQNDTNLTSKLNTSQPIGFVVHGWKDDSFPTFVMDGVKDWPIETVEGNNELWH